MAISVPQVLRSSPYAAPILLGATARVRYFIYHHQESSSILICTPPPPPAPRTPPIGPPSIISFKEFDTCTTEAMSATDWAPNRASASAATMLGLGEPSSFSASLPPPNNRAAAPQRICSKRQGSTGRAGRTTKTRNDQLVVSRGRGP